MGNVLGFVEELVLVVKEKVYLPILDPMEVDLVDTMDDMGMVSHMD